MGARQLCTGQVEECWTTNVASVRLFSYIVEAIPVVGSADYESLYDSKAVNRTFVLRGAEDGSVIQKAILANSGHSTRCRNLNRGRFNMQQCFQSTIQFILNIKYTVLNLCQSYRPSEFHL